ncbi:hypothetical protein [Nitrosomonas sp.]|nr:hypothetical protein [Nitrosomonas sp.]
MAEADVVIGLLPSREETPLIISNVNSAQLTQDEQLIYWTGKI